jgi:hypothetical protein
MIDLSVEVNLWHSVFLEKVKSYNVQEAAVEADAAVVLFTERFDAKFEAAKAPAQSTVLSPEQIQEILDEAHAQAEVAAAEEQLTRLDS